MLNVYRCLMLVLLKPWKGTDLVSLGKDLGKSTFPERRLQGSTKGSRRRNCRCVHALRFQARGRLPEEMSPGAGSPAAGARNPPRKPPRRAPPERPVARETQGGSALELLRPRLAGQSDPRRSWDGSRLLGAASPSPPAAP